MFLRCCHWISLRISSWIHLELFFAISYSVPPENSRGVLPEIYSKAFQGISTGVIPWISTKFFPGFAQGLFAQCSTGKSSEGFPGTAVIVSRGISPEIAPIISPN